MAKKKSFSSSIVFVGYFILKSNLYLNQLVSTVHGFLHLNHFIKKMSFFYFILNRIVKIAPKLFFAENVFRTCNWAGEWLKGKKE